jgi:hypothetical protein
MQLVSCIKYLCRGKCNITVNLGGMGTCFVNSLKIKYICRTCRQQTDPELYLQNIKLNVVSLF